MDFLIIDGHGGLDGVPEAIFNPQLFGNEAKKLLGGVGQ
jgi:hypothetical protein